jgi:ADP-ribose pyrophosphatase YjhB (NUDIX family)
MSLQREYPEKPIVGIGVLIQKNSHYLLIRRASNPDRGLWTVPGGLIEVGERVADAAIREVLEETGLVVKLKERIGVIDKIEYDERSEILYHFIILIYSANHVSGNLRPMDDALDVVWVTKEELDAYDLTKSLKKFLEDKELYPI